MTIEDNIEKIKELVFKEKNIILEMNSILDSAENSRNQQEKKMMESQSEKLKDFLKRTNEELRANLEGANITAPLSESVRIKEPEKEIPKKVEKVEPVKKLSEKISELDKDILKRLKKEKEMQKKKVEKVEKKTSDYTQLANRLFSNYAMTLIRQKKFKTIGRDLVKANLEYSLVSYVSLMLFNTVVTFMISFILFIFLLFFNLSPMLPIITRATESFGTRFLMVFWIIFVFPVGTFLFMNTFPSLEKKSLGGKIDGELPFAAIHMAAISGSMIDPTKIFSIISSTKEYPNLEKEFNKLLNEINVYGYDMVTALKDSALNSPSQKLSELLNGLATTITSGGSLYDFFEKRSQSLLFEYRLEKEKNTKSSESFMDIYISVVIAAPMIFMLLLMMMKISGLGISLSTTMITILVAGGVSLINVFFLIFLQLKQSSTA
ncbi:Type II secretion system (T2SS), protein F [uncultured archaeon]|nr:Type II secretion system (T2SS), protein F [uncultured archaeon]